MVVKECRTDMLINNMDVSRLMVHIQQIQEEKLKERSREAKKAMTCVLCESPKEHAPPFVPVREALKEEDQKGDERRSRCVAKQFREAGLNSRSWIEIGHVGPFGKLDRACQIVRRFAQCLCFTLHMLSLRPVCPVTLNGQTLACRKQSAIRRKDSLIAHLPSLFSQSVDIVRTNLIEQPQKKAKGITINEGGSNPPKRKKDDLQPGDKGKRKKNIARKGINVEPVPNQVYAKYTESRRTAYSIRSRVEQNFAQNEQSRTSN
uniref:Uncharacterized protein n=1 Tax=Solanum tuberosum TaxID=4113 RepID=M1DJZ3_SOLTU